jgi:hypothetical protein
MPSTDVNAASIRFPRKCPHCGRKAEGTYAVSAMRGLDAVLGSYSVPLLLDVPVCRDSLERRRSAALVSLVAILALTAAAAIAAIVFAWRGAWIPAVAAGAVAGVLIAGGRTGWDAALLDRGMLGLYVRSLSSTRLRVGIRRDEYFSEWAKLNRL